MEGMIQKLVKYLYESLGFNYTEKSLEFCTFIYMMSNLEDKSDDMLIKYMPWSPELPEDIRIKNKNLHGKND